MGLDGTHVIEPSKLFDYLLSPTHPTGHDKAAFFGAFGFTIATAGRFADALARHARTRDVARVTAGPFGTKYEVRCRIETPDGRDPCIVAVWIALPGYTTFRLITAYPAPSEI